MQKCGAAWIAGSSPAMTNVGATESSYAHAERSTNDRHPVVYQNYPRSGAGRCGAVQPAGRRPGRRQGESRRVPGLLVAAVFHRARSRLLPGTQHRAGDDHAHGRAAQCGGADHRPDRSVRGSGDARRAERQSQEAWCCDVCRHERPECEPPHGAVRGALGPRRQGEVARGLQGIEADVGARAGQPEHRQGHSGQGRA